MKHYELTYLISPEIPEEESNFFQEKIISLIQEEKGILVGVNKPTPKKLFSLTRKNNQVTLSTVNFQLNPAGLENLQKRIKAEAQILRYLILTKKPTKAVEIIKKPLKVSEPKRKVELKEIEKKLEEILKE